MSSLKGSSPRPYYILLDSENPLICHSFGDSCMKWSLLCSLENNACRTLAWLACTSIITQPPAAAKVLHLTVLYASVHNQHIVMDFNFVQSFQLYYYTYSQMSNIRPVSRWIWLLGPFHLFWLLHSLCVKIIGSNISVSSHYLFCIYLQVSLQMQIPCS